MRFASIVLVALALGCSKAPAPTAASSEPTAPPFQPIATAEPAASAPMEPAPVAPPASASAIASAPASASAAPEPPLPAIEVKNIGMHIGGGPNDNVSKAPIRDSVKPHFDAFRRCWLHAEDPDRKGGDFGVDLLIPLEGGKAEVTQPRTAIKGEAFSSCMVEAFRAIEFLKPKTGKTMVSYSLRFSY